jgi:hypothetical protein
VSLLESPSPEESARSGTADERNTSRPAVPWRSCSIAREGVREQRVLPEHQVRTAGARPRGSHHSARSGYAVPPNPSRSPRVVGARRGGCCAITSSPDPQVKWVGRPFVGIEPHRAPQTVNAFRDGRQSARPRRRQATAEMTGDVALGHQMLGIASQYDGDFGPERGPETACCFIVGSTCAGLRHQFQYLLHA